MTGLRFEGDDGVTYPSMAAAHKADCRFAIVVALESAFLEISDKEFIAFLIDNQKIIEAYYEALKNG
jgi:hypothetical protein